MRLQRSFRAAAGAVLLAVSAAGCSTVVVRNAGSAADSAVEREALARAAGEVSRTAWPKPQGASFTDMLSGVVVGSGDRVTEAEAAEIYISSLGDGDIRRFRLLADADRHLAAAYALAEAARAAADAVRPAKSDISTVETAIGELRAVRDIYLLSLKRLEKEDGDIPPETASTLRAAFNDAIEEIGVAADDLADAVASDRTETLAAPAPADRAYLGGSL